MKKIIFYTLCALAACGTPLTSLAATKSAAWKPATPEGYTAITWVKAPGVASFYKAPTGNGSLDFITRINLSQNRINFIGSTSSLPADWGVVSSIVPRVVVSAVSTTNDITVMPDPYAVVPAVTVTTTASTGDFHNFAFARLVAEAAKKIDTGMQFLWNAPFFNLTMSQTDLSMAIKARFGTTTIISTGSRPTMDMNQPRRMLLINNKKGTAMIQDFDGTTFVSTSTEDIGIEGFAPSVNKSDSASGASARVFVGVHPNSKELVIYCTQSATVGQASAELANAGVPIENQLQMDGGGSASCGYNLPGHFFVEPSRTLPLLMGAAPATRGTATISGNTRSGPGTTFAKVGTLAKGTTVLIVAEKKGWYQLDTGEWVIGTNIKKQ